MNLSVRWYLFLAVVVLMVDRLTKLWALSSCLTQRVLMPGVSCELVFNKGISWGILQAHDTLSQFVLNLVLMGIIVFLFYYTYKRLHTGLIVVGEVLVIAGALGNIVDRLLYGAVIDFIYVGYNGFHFPTFFNIADAAIVVGVFFMLISTRRSHA